MKKTSMQFKKAIKDNVREVSIRLVFFDADNKKYVIKDESLVSFKYNASVEQGLGGIEKKVVNMTLLKNSATSKLEKEAVLYRETWIKYEGKWYSDYQEKFIVTSRKDDDGNKQIKIEAVDELTIIRELPLPYTSHFIDTTLKDYFSHVLGSLSDIYSLDTSLVNQSLKLAYAKSTDTHDTLLELCAAAQCLLRSDFTTQKFIAHDPVDRLNYSSGLLNYTLDDSSDIYTNVIVNLFSPSKSDFKLLGTVSTTVPPAARNYKLGKIEFEELYIPQMIAFDNKIEIDDYVLGSSSYSLTVTSRVNETLSLTAEFYGLDVNSATLSEDNDDNKTKFINNIYIQSPAVYDTFIYKGKAITINYKGNSLYEVGDTIIVDDKYYVMIMDHTLNYTGALSGTIKGVIVNG